jgi:predicted nucleotidyltransferase
MKLREKRLQLGLTQPEAAAILNIPFRTYCRYEGEAKYNDTFKYNQMVSLLNEYAKKVILSSETIKEVVSNVCKEYDVSAVYLFGSYAKSKARSDSDIDLMIVSGIEGIEYYPLLNELETKLKKKIDLLRLETAIQNVKLMNEILKDGIKIYG